MRYYAATAAPFNEVRRGPRAGREKGRVAGLSPVAETNPMDLMRLCANCVYACVVLPRLLSTSMVLVVRFEGRSRCWSSLLVRSPLSSRFAFTQLQTLHPRRNCLRKFSFLYDSREYRVSDITAASLNDSFNRIRLCPQKEPLRP